MIRGVLFDYSGTLFRLEPGEKWGPRLAALDDAQRERLNQVVTTWRPPDGMPAEFLAEWSRRDLDPVLHRRVYLTALERSGVPLEPGMAEAAYERVLVPESWRPYPDAVPALRRLRAAGVRVAVVSNIAWDVRPAFERAGADSYVDEFVLSYVEGVMKPDPKIFLLACQRIGVAPAEALMVGDNADADGGAIAVGCRFAHVEAAPIDERPDALLATLDAHGVG